MRHFEPLPPLMLLMPLLPLFADADIQRAIRHHGRRHHNTRRRTNMLPLGCRYASATCCQPYADVLLMLMLRYLHAAMLHAAVAAISYATQYCFCHYYAALPYAAPC